MNTTTKATGGASGRFGRDSGETPGRKRRRFGDVFGGALGAHWGRFFEHYKTTLDAN
jgi:hypothetical protein